MGARGFGYADSAMSRENAGEAEAAGVSGAGERGEIPVVSRLFGRAAGRGQWRRIAAAAGLALAVAAPMLSACDVVRGSDGPPAATHTPAPTSTSTPTPTETAIPTPTATPTPALPSNPDNLQRWTELPVHYCIAASAEAGFVPEDAFTSTVAQAFLAWGVAAVDDGTCAGPAVDDDGVNEIGWDHLQNADTEQSDVYEAGVTQTRYSECTRGCPANDRISLVEADVRIDTSPPRRFRTEQCLYSTLLHEAGHFLGLDHLPAPAVMAAETSTCPTELTDADLAALRARYGERARPEGGG
jgi:hypothetical protein